MDQPSVAWPAQASDAAPAGYMGAHDGSWILGRGRRQLRIEPDFEGSAGRNEGGGTSAGRVGVSFDGSASRAAPWRASRARDSHGAEAPCGSKASGRSTGQLKGGVGGQAAKSAVLVTVGRRGRRAPVAWGGLRDSQGVPNPCHCCTHEDESSEAGEHMHGTRRRRTSLRPNPPRARLAAENAEGTESTDLDIAAENTDGKDSTDDGMCMCGAEDTGGAQHGMAEFGGRCKQGVHAAWPDGALSIWWGACAELPRPMSRARCGKAAAPISIRGVAGGAGRRVDAPARACQARAGLPRSCGASGAWRAKSSAALTSACGLFPSHLGGTLT